MEMIGYFSINRVVEIDHFGRRARFAGLDFLKTYLPFSKNSEAAAIEGDEDVLARLVPGLVDGLDDHLQRFLVGFQVGGEPALVADGRAVFLPLQDRSSACGRPRPRCAAPREAWSSHRHDHELLEVDAVVGVRPAVDDVDASARAASTAPTPPQILVEWQLAVIGSRRRATAIDTPRMALAPSLLLFVVPSSSSMTASIAA